MGYKTVNRTFQITPQKRTVHFNAIYLSEDQKMLKEVQVTGQRSQMKLEVDRKTFTVDEVLAAAGGSVSDLLENIPSVEVTTDGEISLRGNSSVEVWINGKASGLTSDNRAEILQQIPAESIERIEVIDNPSAKFSPEGSAGIINIVLKRDRRAGYYGSVQTGVNNQKGWNVGGNINYSSKWVDAYANLGYRKRRGNGGNMSDQRYRDCRGTALQLLSVQRRRERQQRRRTLCPCRTHLPPLRQRRPVARGMTMHGNRSNDNLTTYEYGTFDAAGAKTADRLLRRQTWGDGKNHMYNGELSFTHKFNERAPINWMPRWNSANGTVTAQTNTSTTPHISPLTTALTSYSYQYRPMDMLQEDPFFYNRFIYDSDIHALYATANMKFGKFGVMAGLRGEYWKVDTKSIDYYQTETPFKKDYFQLFPSLFLNYELTPTSQIQLNYTRRLRRPWGGQLNSFKNTRDASMIEFGNPELTPEYTNAFSLNYLKTWTNHTLSLGTYYRPTTDVMQRIRYQGTYEGQNVMYMTNLNVAKSQSAGAELILKDKFLRIFDLTTTLNAYYYKLDGFSTIVEGQKVTGEGNENFAWDARVLASVILPYSISVQATGNYRSRSVITQGYRKANGSLDLGLRKTFLNKTFALALNWRDVFNTRQFENYTEGPTFWRHQKNHRDPRINLQLTWNFGNMTQKKRPEREDSQGGNEEENNFGGYEQ